MGDIAAAGPPGKGLGMGQDVAIFRSRARPPDMISCIGGGDNDSERCHCASAPGRDREMAETAAAKIVGLIGDQMAASQNNPAMAHGLAKVARQGESPAI